MKHSIISVAILALISAGPAFAAQKPKSGQPKSHTVSKPAVKTQPATHGKSTIKLQAKSSVKPAKVKTSLKPVKAAKAVKVKTTAKSTSPASKTTVKASKKSTTGNTDGSSTVTTTTTPTTTPPTTTTSTETLSPVQQKLKKNTNLAAKLSSRLPAGTDLMTAAAGFKNLGQFVSTVNASYNQKLSFEGLKTRIVDEGMSLGQAMKDMR